MADNRRHVPKVLRGPNLSPRGPSNICHHGNITHKGQVIHILEWKECKNIQIHRIIACKGVKKAI